MRSPNVAITISFKRIRKNKTRGLCFDFSQPSRLGFFFKFHFFFCSFISYFTLIVSHLENTWILGACFLTWWSPFLFPGHVDTPRHRYSLSTLDYNRQKKVLCNKHYAKSRDAENSLENKLSRRNILSGRWVHWARNGQGSPVHVIMKGQKDNHEFLLFLWLRIGKKKKKNGFYNCGFDYYFPRSSMCTDVRCCFHRWVLSSYLCVSFYSSRLRASSCARTTRQRINKKTGQDRMVEMKEIIETASNKGYTPLRPNPLKRLFFVYKFWGVWKYSCLESNNWKKKARLDLIKYIVYNAVINRRPVNEKRRTRELADRYGRKENDHSLSCNHDSSDFYCLCPTK